MIVTSPPFAVKPDVSTTEPVKGAPVLGSNITNEANHCSSVKVVGSLPAETSRFAPRFETESSAEPLTIVTSPPRSILWCLLILANAPNLLTQIILI